MAAGEEFELRAIAPSDQRRMEAGIFNYGNDMDVTNNPFEITGLERLVELDNDNEIVSRNALEKIKADGVTRKLVGAKIDGEPLGMWLEEFWPVLEAGDAIGRLVSASYSPRLECNMGFVWVPIGKADEGTRIEIASPEGPMTATVTALPFLDPKKEIPAKG
jgi:aminomethyltransferase